MTYQFPDDPNYQLDGPIGFAPPKPTQIMRWVCGVSIYKGVIILWDEDHDPRVQDVIDQIPHERRTNVVAVGERKASLTFILKDVSAWPEEYNDGFHAEGDFFSTCEVVGLKGPWNI